MHFFYSYTTNVKVGDELLVDGGMVRFVVTDKIGPDVICHCTDPGLLLPRANLTFWRNGSLVQEHNAMLPTISSKDWLDIDYGIAEGVDFVAVSFVKSAEVIKTLKSYTTARSPVSQIAVIAKIESIGWSYGSQRRSRCTNTLGTGPSVQQKVVQLCRQLNKPVIVASQLPESMIEYPIPTRAEVADVSEAVGQQADALMLSSESAMGQYPEKALAVLRSVSLRIERWRRDEKHWDATDLPIVSSSMPASISEEICSTTSRMANKLKTDAIFVYTKTG
ncbi:hypothetical protein CRYUN_Cryun23aG0082000 [Craigia yunnanensis]